MKEFLFEYGLFLAKTVTFVVAVVFVVGVAAAASKKARESGGLVVSSLNDRYRTMIDSLRSAVMPKKALKEFAKARKAEAKAKEKSDKQSPRVFVIDFHGDIKATGVASLRKEVSAVLALATPEDEVLLRLENYGGMVHEHGLAAAQLVRIREKGIPLTVTVDRAAASGGYLMACVANRIVAAPFAVVGSIGVLAQIPNFHRMLDQHGVTVEQLKAGRFKRTVTMFGENSDADRDKLREELEDVHRLFGQLIVQYRPHVDLGAVATGEHWYGSRALELGLVDELATSDDILLDRLQASDLYRVQWKGRKKLSEKVAAVVEGSAAAGLRSAARAYQESRFGSG
ncbi:MAG: protease SohB [Gammaproteobacteria bacterium]